ncbi:MAG TPA: hypothetical protein VGR41_08600 [Actinomycetota bacterium]|jgi:hypothetical protein|nr:hypothetical protein [Actinomycetota bacterium]
MKLLFSAFLLLSLVAACSEGSSIGNSLSPEPSITSTLGPFAASDANAVISGLCELSDPDIAVDRANTIFFEQVHSRLHVLAAAVEPIDRSVSGALFEAKQRVELDLAAEALPASYLEDVKRLLEAVAGALDAAGLPATTCG